MLAVTRPVAGHVLASTCFERGYDSILTRRSLRRAVALAFSLSSLGAGVHAQIPVGPPPPPPSTPVATPKPVPGPPGVAAVVNGQKITTSQVSTIVTPRLAEMRKQLNGQATEMLINNALVTQEAKRQGVAVTDAEVNQRLAEVRQQIARSPQGGNLEALLAQSHESMADFKDSLRLRLEAERLMAKKLPPVVAVHARHLLIVTNNPGNNPNMKPHTEADALKIIQKAQDELKSGKSWDEVCKKYSEDPSNKDKGGDLGIIGTGQPYDPTFLNAALALKKGETSPTPVKSIYGYHLIKVDSTSADPTPADKPQFVALVTQTRQQMLQQSLPAYLQSLRQKAKVTTYLVP